MSKWEQWYNAQPKHVQEWMDKQAVWNDIDMFKALATGMIIGFLVGLIF
jgi:ferric-dicitrate binding protein FerR (iron transport regulator)